MNINPSQLDIVVDNVKDNLTYIETIIDATVKSYTESLDEVMQGIRKDIVEIDCPDIDLIEKYFLELSNKLYFTIESAEKLGMYDAISKLGYKNKYNEKYLSPEIDKLKPTVAELTAYAEGESIYEASVAEIYNKAYKIVKSKIDAGQTMINTLSKMISRRMSEMQLSANNSTLNLIDNTQKKQILCEDNNRNFY